MQQFGAEASTILLQRSNAAVGPLLLLPQFALPSHQLCLHSRVRKGEASETPLVVARAPRIRDNWAPRSTARTLGKLRARTRGTQETRGESGPVVGCPRASSSSCPHLPE